MPKREPKLPPLPRLPPILADEVNDALSRAREVMTPDEIYARLEGYRRSIPAQLGILGVLPLDHPFRAGEVIEELDRALKKVDRFRRGGAKEYVAHAVIGAEASRRAAGRPRLRDESYRDKAAPLSDIVAFLDRRDYRGASHGEKGAIVDEAVTHFGVSERKVRRAIKLLKRPKMP